MSPVDDSVGRDGAASAGPVCKGRGAARASSLFMLSTTATEALRWGNVAKNSSTLPLSGASLCTQHGSSLSLSKY